MGLIHNERTKYLASALDRASTACPTVGVFGPVAATLYGVGGTNDAGRVILISVAAIFWVAAAAAFHVLGRRTLGRLQ
jgi:hypothetical protein